MLLICKNYENIVLFREMEDVKFYEMVQKKKTTQRIFGKNLVVTLESKRKLQFNSKIYTIYLSICNLNFLINFKDQIDVEDIEAQD